MRLSVSYGFLSQTPTAFDIYINEDLHYKLQQSNGVRNGVYVCGEVDTHAGDARSSCERIHKMEKHARMQPGAARIRRLTSPHRSG